MSHAVTVLSSMSNDVKRYDRLSSRHESSLEIDGVRKDKYSHSRDRSMDEEKQSHRHGRDRSRSRDRAKK